MQREKIPSSTVTCLFVLTALDALIVYMSCSHVSIHLTWFLVPMLSLLFCSKGIYFYAVILNYLLMFTTTLVTAPYYLNIRTDHESIEAYFADVMSGYTIETIIMFASGYIIGKLTLEYFKMLFSQYTMIREQERSMQEKMDLLSKP